MKMVAMEGGMQVYQLSDEDIESISEIISSVKLEHRLTEDPEFLDEISLFAHQMPIGVRRFLNNFKRGHLATGVCSISGFPIDDEKIGATPEHWMDQSDVESTLEERIFHFMCASLLGETFGWETQQAGHIVHDVFPIKEYESEQLGFSSQEFLTWHTEDAFHAYRPDYLALMCLRNPDGVGTLCSAPNLTELTQRQVDLLFRAEYVIKPDNSHRKEYNPEETRGDESGDLGAAFDRIDEMGTRPCRVPVLYGNRGAPFLRVDPFFMEPPEREESKQALDALMESIERNQLECQLQQGDILFIDNLRVAHGRNPFKARYDGTDRWLKRLLITSDLRKSRERRAEDHSRILS